MHSPDPRRFGHLDHPGTAVVLVATVLVFGGFLALTIRRLRRMDVP